jgi:hypothetical protein
VSVNRENVIWQSEDGTWSRGFYDYVTTGDDYEWDVEYLDSFMWVRTGLRSEDAAHDAWDGANPGGYSVARWSETPEYTDRLDAKAAAFKAAGKGGAAW